MKQKTVWLCTGCGAKASDSEWKEGKKTCWNKPCANYGKPLQKRLECGDCGALMKETEEHTCDSC